MIQRNKIELIGWVGRDPEYYTGTYNPRATFSVATSESYAKKNGEPVDITYWHDCIGWNVVADKINSYVKKGSLIMIEGKLTYWEQEKEGFGKVKRASIKVDSFIILREPRGGGSQVWESTPKQVTGENKFSDKGVVFVQPTDDEQFDIDINVDYDPGTDDLPF
jgi:single-strand DNA-binding protein